MKTPYLIRICSAMLLAAASPQITAQEATPPSLPQVVLIGDSIRAGYKDAVIKALEGKAVVTTPKENCKSSVYVRENLAKWLGDARPDIVHINAGLHDLVLTAPGTNFTDIAAYKENVAAIIDDLKKRGVKTIIWATTTPVNDELNSAARASGTKDGKRVAWRENAQVIRFNQVALEAIGGKGVIVNDLYTAVHDMNDQDLYLEDGVHFSIYGREFLGSAVAKSIAGHLPEK